jgi:hypothetical protein
MSVLDINAPFDVILVTPTAAFNHLFLLDFLNDLLNDSTKIPVVPAFI